MLPALAYGLASIYFAGRLYDTARFWSDYARRTGYYPRYPFINGTGGAFSYSSSFLNNFGRY